VTAPASLEVSFWLRPAPDYLVDGGLGLVTSSKQQIDASLPPKKLEVLLEKSTISGRFSSKPLLIDPIFGEFLYHSPNSDTSICS
jgi:hypothetical protein